MTRCVAVFVTVLLLANVSNAESEETHDDVPSTQQSEKERINPDLALGSANRRMAQLHWQQAVAARDVEHDCIKAGHHFLHAGKLWASVGSPKDVVDALHAARSVCSLVHQTFGHDTPIRSATVSSDGKLLCTSLKEGNAACIWSLQTGKRLLKLEHPDGVVRSVFHPDGKLLATSCYDGVSVWDLGTGKLVNSFTPNAGTRIHGPPDEVLFRSKTRQVVVRNRGRIFLWDPDRGAVIQELEPWTTDMQLNREGDEVLAAGRDGTARIWSLDSGKQLSAFNHPRPAIARRVLYLPTGNILTFALDDPRQGFSSTGRIWSREKDEPIATLAEGHGLNSLAISRDGKHVLSAGIGSLLTYDAFLWSTDDGSKVATYTHEEKITAAHFATTYPSTISQNIEDLVVTYTKAGTVKIWSRKDHKLRHVLRYPDGIRGLAISDDSQWLAIWGEKGVAKVYAMPDNLVRSPLLELRQVLRHERAIGGLIFLRGGSRALTWSDDGLARTWNLRAGQPTSMLFCFTPGSIGRPPPIHSAGDGYWWTNWPRGSPSLWARQRQPVRTWPKDERFRRAEVRNRRVLTWGDDEVARVWKLDGEKPIRELQHEAKIHNAMYLPGGESVLTVGGRAVKTWNLEDDKPVRNYELPSSVIAVEPLPDGKGVVVGCQARQIVVLSFDRDEPVKTLTSDAPIVGIRLSTDGQRVASWDAKRKLSVWRLDGAMARTFDFPIESEFELSPDLSLLLTTISARRHAWLYSLESGRLLKQFHRDGEADRELFRFRLAGAGQIASWGSRPHSGKIRLRIWSTTDLSEPTIEYDLPGLPQDFVVQPDGIAMARFGSNILALSLSEHRVLRSFGQHRFGLNQMLFHPTTSQLYTTNPRGEFWQWDFRREDPKSIQRTLDEFEARSGMTIDGNAKYRIRR